MTGVILFSAIVLCVAFVIKSIFITELSASLPAAFNLIVVTLYLFGVFQILYFGVIAIIISVIVALVYLRNQLNFNRFDVVVLSLYVLTIVLFVLIHYGRLAYWSDDLAHWALTTKDIYYTGRFAIFEPIRVGYTQYLEMPSMPAYMAMVLNGKWEEWILFFVQSLWTCTLLFPLLQKKQSVAQRLFVFCFILIYPMIWGGTANAYSALQVDRLIGVSIGYCIIMCFFEFESVKINVFSVLLGTMSLTGLKESGLLFSSITLILLFIRLRRIKPCSRKRLLLTLLMVAGGNLIVFCSWRLLFKLSGPSVVDNYFRSFTFGALRDIINGKDAVRHNTLIESLYKLVQIEGSNIGSIKSYSLWGMIYVGILLYISRKRKDRVQFLAKTIIVGGGG